MKNKKHILAYTAGIIDGEGCITFTSISFSPNRPKVIRLVVAVANTNEWLPRWLMFQFGGSVQYKKSRKVGYKDQWQWVTVAKQAGELLKLIVPYLQMKRPQAELAIAFQDRKRKNQKRSSETIALEQADKILIQQMNKKGMHDINLVEKGRRDEE